VGRRNPAAVSAVGSRKIVNHACLAGEEQLFVDRRGEGHSRIRMARHGMRLGAARIRIARPRGRGDRMQALPHAFAEERSKLTDGKARECSFVFEARERKTNVSKSGCRSRRFPSCPVRVGVNLLEMPQHHCTAAAFKRELPRVEISASHTVRGVPKHSDPARREGAMLVFS